MILLIATILVIGFGLAALVGRLADRDKAKREAAEAAAGGLKSATAPAAPAGPTTAADLGACPSCKTPYRAELVFCWACGRDRVPPTPP